MLSVRGNPSLYYAFIPCPAVRKKISERDKKYKGTTNGKSNVFLLKNMWRTMRCGTTPPLSLVIPRKQAKETSVRLKPVSTINLRTCRLPTSAN